MKRTLLILASAAVVAVPVIARAAADDGGTVTLQCPQGALEAGQQVTCTVTGVEPAPTTTVPPTTVPPTTVPATTVPPTTVAPTTVAPTTTMPPMHVACPNVPDVTPYGALPPALPMLCDHLSTGVAATFTQSTNTWLDNFDHHASMTDMGSGYQMFEKWDIGANGRTGHFRHNDHWMTDVYTGSTSTMGGAMMRPDRTFRFQDGKLIVEADVAAGIADYIVGAWPEIVVTTSSSPAGSRHFGSTPGRSIGDSLYAYGQFGGYDTIGIRLHSDRRPIMAYYDSTERGFPCGRQWELAWYLDGSDGCNGRVANKWGGGEWAAPGAFRQCSGTDPDTNCRDRFRWELSRDVITLYVNGFKYMEHTAIAGKHLVPDALLNGDVFVYFADTVSQAPQDRAVRFHWDRLAVNPATGPTAAPGFTG